MWANRAASARHETVADASVANAFWTGSRLLGAAIRIKLKGESLRIAEVGVTPVGQSGVIGDRHPWEP